MATANLFTDIGQQDQSPDPITTTDPDLRLAAQATAKKYNLDPDMFSKMINAESSFNPTATSTKGAIGLGQLMPTTASVLGVQNPKDPYQNLDGSAKYLRQQLDRFQDPRQALAAYNWGPENVATGKDWPSETKAYVNKIIGAPTEGKANVFSDLHPDDTVATPDQNSNAKAPFNIPDEWQKLKSYAQTAGPEIWKAFNQIAPSLVGAGVGGILGGPPGVIGGAVAATVAQGARQAGLVQSGQIDPETAARNVRNEALANLGAGFGGEALDTIMPAISKWTYAKLAGVLPNDAKGMEAVSDMLDKNIPAGIGFYKRLGSLKNTENSALNDIYAKYPMGASTQALVNQGAALPATANAVSKKDLFGDIAAYYIHNSNAPVKELEAALGKDGAAMVEKVRAGQPITQGDFNTAFNNTDSNNAYGNFLGRKGNDISFTDAREIKQNLQAKVPYGDEKEGIQQARAVVAHQVVENIAKNIPDATDRAAFLSHNAELEKLINIERLPGLGDRTKKIIAGQIAMPVAGAIGGAASGFYSHQDPWAAAGRGAIFGALTGATLPSGAALLMNNNIFRQGLTAPVRQFGQTPPATAARVSTMTPEQRKAIQDFLAKDEQ